MNFDDEQLLVQKAAFERDLPSENEHGNFCEKASFECTDCLFTGCLFTGCLFTRCWFRSCLFTSCLFVEPVACSPVTSGTGCLFSSYLFISCLFRFFHQLPIQVFKRFMCCRDSSLPIAAYLASRCFPASGRSFRGRHGCFLASFLARLYKFKIR